MPKQNDQTSTVDRRELLKMLGAGLATTSLGACMERPKQEILPWADRPPEIAPGLEMLYATSLEVDGYATGLLGKCINARPIKIEGNPQHPSSLGATTAIEQASLFELYDPERSRLKSPLERGVPVTRRKIAVALAAARRPGIVIGPQSSPLIASLLDRLRDRYPDLLVVQDAPLARRSVYRGAELVFGRPLEPIYDFTKTRVVLSLDADFTAAMPGSTRYARLYAPWRRPSETGEMGRLYVAEPAPTPTGTIADHRLAVPAGAIAAIAAAILAEVGGSAHRPLVPASDMDEPIARWARVVARDLSRHRGGCLVVCGDRQPAGVHAMVHLINAALGNLGRTVALIDPVVLDPLGPTLGDLASALDAGALDALVIAGSDPVGRDGGRQLGRLIATVDSSLHVSPVPEATTGYTRWSLPLAHPFEQWRDGRGHDGTLTIGQPLIRPLHGGLALSVVLANLAGARTATSHDLLLTQYAKSLGGLDRWREIVRLGFVPDSASPPRSVQPNPGDAAATAIRSALGRPAEGIEIDLVASPAIHDGQFARVPWLQELPKPVSKLTWGNAAQISPVTAVRLGVGTGDVVRVAVDGRRVTIPVLVLGGHADGAVTIEVGYGQEIAGETIGVDAYGLRRTRSFILEGAELAPTGQHVALAVTQGSLTTHGREIALGTTLERYLENPDFTADHRGELPSLLPEREWTGPQWAMSIDTSVCTGCSACVVACQVENNVQAVGREGVLRNREMHWLRIDTYVEHGEPLHQPMLCQHCEMAPCEYVCPTYATVHSPDGLNEMIYNRCIGTRFCSNNCPYKVRRFNWFDYTEPAPELIKLGRNPDVTVRGRGVMEKCTYCVQRIRRAEIDARMDNREIRPNEVRTACQQACPTGAIEFGSLHHTDTQMVEMRDEPRRYFVLHREGTRPRTMYLARIRNPNPELSG